MLCVRPISQLSPSNPNFMCQRMAMKRLLLFLKPFDANPVLHSDAFSRVTTPQILRHLENRHEVHREAINFCKDILQQKHVDWESVSRNDLSEPITNVDLVVTVGGDGTLLRASHFLDESIPILGVNSDPTQVDEVEEFSNEFDASRSTGHLCAATVNNFEQVLDSILNGEAVPSKLSRMSLSVNSELLSKYPLNDVLIAHPCPASVSRFSFKIRNEQSCSLLLNCRSSGLRVSTAAGSTAAMLSAGGFPMPILSQKLQYMVREPIAPGKLYSFMHGTISPDQSIEMAWLCNDGVIYIDGSHVCYPIQYGDIVEISSKAPSLRVFLPHHMMNMIGAEETSEQHTHPKL
ncbi:NADH kinase isoform X1 [Cucumis melo var. makuwa]|uniref:NADH kinase n=2 Tax=Cucumis melo TaxID=3656 RepID=A0A5D3CWJ3_CUCMM|nr:NADH kinase isoform X1 [Cucumis melo var. makuwa]